MSASEIYGILKIKSGIIRIVWSKRRVERQQKWSAFASATNCDSIIILSQTSFGVTD
jgi:hypothetical protein